MPYNTTHDLTGHHRESTTRQRGAAPLYSYDPLPANRERKPPAQAPKKRRRPAPSTSALSYPSCDRLIPNGIRDPSPPTSSRPATSETSINAYEQQTTSFGDCEMLAQLHDEYDAQEWSHISDHSSGHSISPDTSYPENDMSSVGPDPYDSSASYTSSSSDQSPRTTDFSISGIEYAPPVLPSAPICAYDTQGYVAIHQGSYPFPMDSYPEQGYPVQYVEFAHGRQGLHGGPPCPGNNGYQYPNSRRS